MSLLKNAYYTSERTACQIGVLEMFKIGIGPSSSHTMGPMLAARTFREQLLALPNVKQWHVSIELYGSLSATGRGHYTAEAISAGLLGLDAATTPIEEIWAAHPRLLAEGGFDAGSAKIEYQPSRDLAWQGYRIDGEPLRHPNTIRLRASGEGRELHQVARSIGGGFVEFDAAAEMQGDDNRNREIAHPFNTAADLIDICTQQGLTLAEIALANEISRNHNEAVLRRRLWEIWQAMDASIERGLQTEGILPGGLNVRRRACQLYSKINEGKVAAEQVSNLRLSAFAMAVNEENAAGGRVVTAPTNGAAGLLPAVIKELLTTRNLTDHQITDGLLVAGLIGAMIKVGASISGAEVGCQGEVGAACAMAAGAATAMQGGNILQIESAAEMAIEHHLGMTCDPVGGLVQIPCIERNAVGAAKALHLSSLALSDDGSHLVSFDRALSVMKQTGMDMKTKYKETGSGGLGIG